MYIYIYNIYIGLNSSDRRTGRYCKSLCAGCSATTAARTARSSSLAARGAVGTRTRSAGETSPEQTGLEIPEGRPPLPRELGRVGRTEEIPAGGGVQ